MQKYVNFSLVIRNMIVPSFGRLEFPQPSYCSINPFNTEFSDALIIPWKKLFIKLSTQYVIRSDKTSLIAV